ncbi:hypothetical protein TrLO_g2046 [Triparma laevis f. longispina]|uniref:Uncharacterized protein n=1 Tax=Triparma laevis f. longispina TaxID=1714387 RepID=A0A9W7KRP4_9STRA|nr:hypothetical protein TrLO_g2046 [Triparma laevis f. longispina]
MESKPLPPSGVGVDYDLWNLQAQIRATHPPTQSPPSRNLPESGRKSVVSPTTKVNTSAASNSPPTLMSSLAKGTFGEVGSHVRRAFEASATGYYNGQVARQDGENYVVEWSDGCVEPYPKASVVTMASNYVKWAKTLWPEEEPQNGLDNDEDENDGEDSVVPRETRSRQPREKKVKNNGDAEEANGGRKKAKGGKDGKQKVKWPKSGDFCFFKAYYNQGASGEWNYGRIFEAQVEEGTLLIMLGKENNFISVAFPSEESNAFKVITRQDYEANTVEYTNDCNKSDKNEFSEVGAKKRKYGEMEGGGGGRRKGEKGGERNIATKKSGDTAPSEKYDVDNVDDICVVASSTATSGNGEEDEDDKNLSTKDIEELLSDRDKAYNEALKTTGIKKGANHNVLEVFMKAFPKNMGWTVSAFMCAQPMSTSADANFRFKISHFETDHKNYLGLSKDQRKSGVGLEQALYIRSMVFGDRFKPPGPNFELKLSELRGRGWGVEGVVEEVTESVKTTTTTKSTVCTEPTVSPVTASSPVMGEAVQGIPDPKEIFEDRERAYAEALKREGIKKGGRHGGIDVMMNTFPYELGWSIKAYFSQSSHASTYFIKHGSFVDVADKLNLSATQRKQGVGLEEALKIRSAIHPDQFKPPEEGFARKIKRITQDHNQQEYLQKEEIKCNNKKSHKALGGSGENHGEGTVAAKSRKRSAPPSGQIVLSQATFLVENIKKISAEIDRLKKQNGEYKEKEIQLEEDKKDLARQNENLIMKCEILTKENDSLREENEENENEKYGGGEYDNNRIVGVALSPPSR